MDPLNDHGPAIGQGNILYGENSFGSTHASAVLPSHQGANVFCCQGGEEEEETELPSVASEEVSEDMSAEAQDEELVDRDDKKQPEVDTPASEDAFVEDDEDVAELP